MKKTASILLSALLLCSLSIGANAASDKAQKDFNKSKQSVEQEQAASDATEITDQATSDDKVTSVEEDSTESSDVGKTAKKTPKGLENAYEHVKETPAGERIAEILKTKYNIDVNAEDSVTDVVYGLEQAGELNAAVEVQAEVILQDVNDIESYKAYGKLKKKLGEENVITFINGQEKEFDVAPVVKNGRALVPFRGITESLNAEVNWESKTNTVTIKRDGIEVILVVGETTALINGQKVTLDVPGQVVNQRVLVPIRFLIEVLKAEVIWEPETGSVIVLDPSVESDTSVEAAASGVSE